MTYVKNPRELILLNEVEISETGAQDWIAIRQPWGINPRFQLVVTDHSDPAKGAVIRIEHTLADRTQGEILYSGFAVSADGIYKAYTEEIATRFPFAFIRAYVESIDSGLTLTATLAGIFDRSY